MKIASWNVNSIKARSEIVKQWLEDNPVDILCIQELKSLAENVPTEIFEELGYQVFIKGQKTYNGVATLIKSDITAKLTTDILPGDDADEQARFLELEIDNKWRLINIYLPNGNPVDTEKYPYKLGWMERLYHHLQKRLQDGHQLIVCGDYNIIPEDKDCYDPKAWDNDALFKIESRQAFRKILGLGFYEAYAALNPSRHEAYTFWDYQAGCWPQNKGIRIDHFLLSGRKMDQLSSCSIDAVPRGWEKPSDHTPIIIEGTF